MPLSNKRITKWIFGLLAALWILSVYASRPGICEIAYEEAFSGIVHVPEEKLGSFIVDLSSFANEDGRDIVIQSFLTVDSYGQRPITRLALCGKTTSIRAINATSSSEFHIIISHGRIAGISKASRLKSFLVKKWGMQSR